MVPFDEDLEQLACSQSQKLDRLEEKRQKALSTYSSIAYKRLCDRLDIEPESPELYEQGQAEEKIRHAKESAAILRDSLLSDRREITDFLGESRRLSSNVYYHPKEKTDLLRKYFPRFRTDYKGRYKQDISRYPSYKIGVLFNSIVSSYRERLSSIEQQLEETNTLALLRRQDI